MSLSKFYYLDGFVAVPRDRRDEAAAILGGDVFTPIEVLMATGSDPAFDSSTYNDAEATVDEVLGLIAVTEPTAAAADVTLQANGIECSVINLVGLTHHWRPLPGTDPEAISAEVPAPPEAEEGLHIGVIDTGVVSTGPSWLVNHLVSDPQDEETVVDDGASHGTFIAGLLARLACSHKVSAARLPMIDPSRVRSVDPSEPLESAVSTEFHLLFQIVRLLNRTHAYSALNLSIGTYTRNDLRSLIMQIALDMWFTATDGAPVFAAGGNDYEGANPYSPLWPAAFGVDPWYPNSGQVVGVGAVNISGQEVVWDAHPVGSPATEQLAPTGIAKRPWIKVRAPGTDLISLAGGIDSNGEPNLVKWSGSSFATPVALANSLRNVGGDTAHGDVEGLVYDDSGTVRTTDWSLQSTCTPPNPRQG